MRALNIESLPSTMGTPGKSADAAAAMAGADEKAAATISLKKRVAKYISGPSAALDVAQIFGPPGKETPMPIVEKPMPRKLEPATISTTPRLGGDRTRNADSRTSPYGPSSRTSDIGIDPAYVTKYYEQELAGTSRAYNRRDWVSLKLDSPPEPDLVMARISPTKEARLPEDRKSVV
jgi:hypothetical protein